MTYNLSFHGAYSQRIDCWHAAPSSLRRMDIRWDIYLPKCTDTTLETRKLLQWPEDQTTDQWTVLYHLAVILATVVQETAFISNMAHNSRNDTRLGRVVKAISIMIKQFSTLSPSTHRRNQHMYTACLDVQWVLTATHNQKAACSCLGTLQLS